jgi:hypothetical protein
MRARLDKRWIVGMASALLMLTASLFVLSSANAGAATCDISRYIGPDGKLDTASYLQCQLPAVSPNTVAPGGVVHMTAGGFAADCSVTITLQPTGTELTTTPADGFGNISVDVTIPPNTPVGAYELWATCTDPAGNPLTDVLSITVTQTPTTTSGTLPVTGVNVGQLVGLGLALVALGGAAVWGARRERTSGEV